MNRSTWGIRKWAAAGALMSALVLGISGLWSPSTSSVADAAPSAGGLHFSLPVALSSSNINGVRRESGLPLPDPNLAPGLRLLMSRWTCPASGPTCALTLIHNPQPRSARAEYSSQSHQPVERGGCRQG